MACQVEAVKLFVLKTINLGMLVYQLFLIQTNANTAQQYLRLPNYADYLAVCLPPFCHMTTSTQALGNSRVQILREPGKPQSQALQVQEMVAAEVNVQFSRPLRIYICLSVQVLCNISCFTRAGMRMHPHDRLLAAEGHSYTQYVKAMQDCRCICFMCAYTCMVSRFHMYLYVYVYAFSSCLM